MSVDTAIELIESIKKYMIGEDGNLQIEDIERDHLADAMADCAVGHLADEAQKDADIATAFHAFLLDMDRLDPPPEDPHG